MEEQHVELVYLDDKPSSLDEIKRIKEENKDVKIVEVKEGQYKTLKRIWG